MTQAERDYTTRLSLLFTRAEDTQSMYPQFTPEQAAALQSIANEYLQATKTHELVPPSSAAQGSPHWVKKSNTEPEVWIWTGCDWLYWVMVTNTINFMRTIHPKGAYSDGFRYLEPVTYYTGKL